MEICCNIINVFTVTFDQFNACLLNKIIYFKNVLMPKCWIVGYIIHILPFYQVFCVILTI